MGNQSSSANGSGRHKDSGSATVTATGTGTASGSSPSRTSSPQAGPQAGAGTSGISLRAQATAAGPSEPVAASGSSRSLAAAANSAALAAAEAARPTLYPQDSRVDNGHLVPLSNIYPSSAQDWIHDTVQRLIVERKLAPFYRGLEDWDGEDSFDKDEIDAALSGIGDDRSKAWRKDKMTDQDRADEAAMYQKASECPICFL